MKSLLKMMRSMTIDHKKPHNHFKHQRSLFCTRMHRSPGKIKQTGTIPEKCLLYRPTQSKKTRKENRWIKLQSTT